MTQNEIDIGVKTVKKIDVELSEKSSISSPNFLKNNEQDVENIAETSIKKKQLTENSPSTLFWVLDRNSFILRMARTLHESNCFDYIIWLAVFIHAITLVIRTDSDSRQKEEIIEIIEKIPIGIYFLELILGVLGNGFYF